MEYIPKQILQLFIKCEAGLSVVLGSAFTLEVALEKTSRQEQHTDIYPAIREQRE